MMRYLRVDMRRRFGFVEEAAAPDEVGLAE